MWPVVAYWVYFPYVYGYYRGVLIVRPLKNADNKKARFNESGVFVCITRADGSFRQLGDGVQGPTVLSQGSFEMLGIDP